MAIPNFQVQVRHIPTASAPVADDGSVRIAIVFDNQSNAPSLALVWQHASTTKPDEWMHVPDTDGTGRNLWTLFTTSQNSYTHTDGTRVSGSFEAIVEQFGDRLVFDYLPEMNKRLTAFFEGETGGMDAMDILYAALRQLRFQSGQVVKVPA